MAKITIDRRIRGLSPDAEMGEEALEKAFQVALATLGHLDTIVHQIKVEIVKVSWKTKEKWEEGKSPLLTDFQVVFRLFSGEKKRAVLRFGPEGIVSIYDDDPEKDGSYITSWMIHPDKELEVDHITNLLLQAMGLVTGRYASLYVKAAREFERIRDSIESVRATEAKKKNSVR